MLCNYVYKVQNSIDDYCFLQFKLEHFCFNALNEKKSFNLPINRTGLKIKAKMLKQYFNCPSAHYDQVTELPLFAHVYNLTFILLVATFSYTK